MYKISDIQQIFPNWYEKDSELSYDEQKWIWENLPLPKEDELKIINLINVNKNAIANGSVIGTYKRRANSEQKLSKHQAIAELKSCRYKTAPKEIAYYLEILFGIWEEKPGHWLYIAQRHTPKTINAVIAQMVKERRRGDRTLQIPGAYFTKLIKYKPKRKYFRATNGTCKPGGTNHDNS